MSLFAGNVSLRASAEDVRIFFSKFGPCRVDVKRGYAFIDYDDDLDAEDARNNTNGKDFHGMKLNVEWSKKHIARTSGRLPSSHDWDRRSRYDDRRFRDHDRGYDRDYYRGRHGSPFRDRDRHDRDRDRDRGGRDRDYDRRHRDDRAYDRNRNDRDRRDRDHYDRYDHDRGDRFEPPRDRDSRGFRGDLYDRRDRGDRRRYDDDKPPRHDDKDRSRDVRERQGDDKHRRDDKDNLNENVAEPSRQEGQEERPRDYGTAGPDRGAGGYSAHVGDENGTSGDPERRNEEGVEPEIGADNDEGARRRRLRDDDERDSDSEIDRKRHKGDERDDRVPTYHRDYDGGYGRAYQERDQGPGSEDGHSNGDENGHRDELNHRDRDDADSYPDGGGGSRDREGVIDERAADNNSYQDGL